MANPVRVVVTADTASMQAELGAATKTLVTFGDTSKFVFGTYTESALKAQLASDRLAVSLARVPEGSAAAAAAVLKYRSELDALAASETAASKAQVAAMAATSKAQIAATKEVGAAMTRYITAPALLVAGAALKLGTDFQSAMLRIETQAGASGAEVHRLTGQVLDLAKSGAQQGPTQLAEGLYHLESLGLRGAEAMRALKVSSDAAALGSANLADVTTALGGVIVTGISGAENYQKAMGTLNATIGAGNLTMPDLIGFLGTGVVPAAKQAGVNLTELGAALAVMTDRGISADMAGTRLRMTFALMEAPSSKAQKALADMGINADTMAQTLRKPNGLLEVLRMLQAGMDSVGKVQGSRDILGAFGGGRSGAGILTLVQSLDSATSSYQGKVTQIAAQNSRLTSLEAEQQKSAAATFHRDLAGMESDLVSLGGAMLPTVTAIVNGLNKIGDGFSALPGPVKHELGIIVAALAVGGPLLLAVVGAKKMIASIGDAFGLIPAKAGVAIATTDAELAGLGVTAEKSAVKVNTLRLGLLGLAGKVFVTSLILDMIPRNSGGQSELDKKGLGWLGGVPGFGPLATQIAEATTPFDHTSDPIGSVPAATGKSPYQKGTALDDIFEAARYGRKQNGKIPANGPQRAALILGETYRQSDQNRTSLVSDAGSGGQLGLPVGGTGASGVAPLTRAQKLQLGLDANPNSAALLQLKLADDRAKLAQLDKQRAAGTINNTAYVAKAGPLQSDIHSTEAQIASTRQASASATSGELSRLRANQRIPNGRGSYGAGEAAHFFERIPQHARGSLAATPFEVPIELRVAAAKAATTSITTDDVRVAREIKKFAQTVILSRHLQGQALIDAYNEITAQNQTIGTSTTAAGYHAASSKELLAGVHFASLADKRREQMRIAQVIQHDGRVPTGPAAQGFALGPIHINVDGREIARVTIPHMQRGGFRGTATRSGQYPGVNRALS